MSRENYVGVLLDAVEKAALDRAKIEARQTLSALSGKIISDWLREHGYLPLAKIPVSQKFTKNV